MKKCNEKPILFSGEMVRAILDGRKTQTRRVVKPQAEKYTGDILGQPVIYPWRNGGYDAKPIKCPYGKPGEELWVRETFTYGYDLNDAHPECAVFDFGDPDMIFAPGENKETRHYARAWSQRKPGIYMPRWASRIQLQVKDIKVKRVQDITESDAIAEGLTYLPNAKRWGVWDQTNCTIDGRARMTEHFESPVDAFAHLWDSINRKRGYGWDKNPWVWVVTFERIRP
ncbi:MAG: hypothetical protein GF334_05040 [Candidatus Altiarchaeales archaeon]|nr:hypothetical protein [Candidatus Altiarchaeales archaeon]